MDNSRLAQVVRSSPSSQGLYVFEGVDFGAFLDTNVLPAQGGIAYSTALDGCLVITFPLSSMKVFETKG